MRDYLCGILAENTAAQAASITGHWENGLKQDFAHRPCFAYAMLCSTALRVSSGLHSLEERGVPSGGVRGKRMIIHRRNAQFISAGMACLGSIAPVEGERLGKPFTHQQLAGFH